MLISLTVSHLAIIDHASISFDSGFNVLSGETGAGKTILIEALQLCLGQRADESVIQKNQTSAKVEALFDIESNPQIEDILEEYGIPFEKNEYLIIKREINREKKNQAFVNAVHVPSSFLQKIGTCLLKIVSQKKSHEILSTDFQRDLLDIFGNLQEDKQRVSDLYFVIKNREKKLSIKLEEKEKKDSTLDTLRYQLEELDEVQFDKELEYINEQELALSFHHVYNALHEILLLCEDENHSPISQLNLLLQKSNAISSFDPKLKTATNQILEASHLIDDALDSFSRYLHSMHFDPARMEFLENELSKIFHLKKKFNLESNELHSLSQKISSKIDELELIEESLEQDQNELMSLNQEFETLCYKLRDKRKKAATQFENQVSSHLSMLNMPHAKFQVQFLEQVSSQGMDKIEFFLSSNKGSTFLSLKESASGGEIARCLLAISLLMSEKAQVCTTVFDEIDANIGGETASIIGKMLQKLGANQQVFAITHFPQVACEADYHLKVSKKTESDVTKTTIELLDESQRKKELIRMLGGDEKRFTTTSI